MSASKVALCPRQSSGAAPVSLWLGTLFFFRYPRRVAPDGGEACTEEVTGAKRDVGEAARELSQSVVGGPLLGATVNYQAGVVSGYSVANAMIDIL